jgi:hypothetical protein
MIGSAPWDLRRYLTLAGVLILHSLGLWALFDALSGGAFGAAPFVSVELLSLPTGPPSQVRPVFVRSKPLSSDRAGRLAVIAPGSVPAAVGPTSPSAGEGAGVDWAAEARRALQAYEIRSHRPSGNISVSGESGEEWLRQLQHHVGDQVRTPSGDWIVWISDDCYQVAKAGPNMYAGGAVLPQTVCLERVRTEGR